ncbi:MAG: hypothetical protein JRE47_06450 [Deltaproteobacteria bacterium]|nr:hypothetical protein [Deltaproteobacteria bacterium]
MPDQNSNNLIVPVNIKALCIGNIETDESKDIVKLAKATSDFSSLPYYSDNKNHNEGPYISDKVNSKPFETSGIDPEPGIHIHWTLPEALSSGINNKDGDIIFPLIPNRWMVTRIVNQNYTSENSSISTKSWVIESDYLSTDFSNNTVTNNTGNVTVPSSVLGLPEEQSCSCYYLGKTFDYESWQEGQDIEAKRFRDLTALGHGDFTFSGFYPNCRGALGFYDDLADLEDITWDQSRISYVVVGWYRDASKDPLSQIDFNSDENTYKWTFNNDGTNNVPQSTLCSGFINNIHWDPGTKFLNRDNNSNLDIAVGNNSIEALSALLASQAGPDMDKKSVEYILNALQLGALEKLDTPDGSAHVEQALHQSEFKALSGGIIWRVTEQEKEGNVDPKESEDKDFTLPDSLSKDLHDLNVIQQNFNRTQDEIACLRWQIYSNWYKWMMLEYPDPSNEISCDINDASGLINDQLSDLDIKKSDLDQLSQDLQDKKTSIENQLDDEYILKSLPAPRYWQPQEPVMLFSGESVKSVDRRGKRDSLDPKGYLKCRISSEIINAVKFSIDQSSIDVTGEDLCDISINSSGPYSQEIINILYETLFLDSNNAIFIAKKIISLQQYSGAGDVLSIKDQVVTTQEEIISQDNSALVDTQIPPAPVAISQWNKEAAWLPIFMQWNSNYYPIESISPDGSNVYNQDLILNKYKLDEDQIDLNLTAEWTDGALQLYQGNIVLSPHASINLKQQIDDFINNNPDDPKNDGLSALYENMDNMALLCQSLSGFNQALLMRSQTYQLKVADPLGYPESIYEFSNTDVRNAVINQNTLGPLPNNYYNPIRAGLLKFKGEGLKIRIIDAFGQIRDIDLDKIKLIRAESFIPKEDITDHLDDVFLSPRITQPSRLLFRFLSAKEEEIEMNSHPLTSPICGWVVPNHIDRSLMIYDQNGEAIGSVVLTDNQNQLNWQSAPGSDTIEQANKTDEIGDAFNGHNSYLKDFVLGAYNNGAQFIKQFLDTIDLACTTINPQNSQQEQGLSVLIGKPLALVRASLKLEIQGLPASNQSWDWLKDGFNSTADFTKVKFPIRLGDLTSINDGLIGYFKENSQQQADYTTFYAPASGSDGENGITAPESDTITLTCDSVKGDDKIYIITMLLDPQAKVHLTSGILPIKDIQIPPEQYSKALNSMEVTFLTSPLLNPLGNVALSLPKEKGYTWQWVERKDNNEWKNSEIGAVNDKALINYSPQKIAEGWLKLIKTIVNNDE